MRRLYEYRTFYNVYPQLKDEIISYIQSQNKSTVWDQSNKLRAMTAIFQIVEDEDVQILQSLPAISLEPWQTTPDRLFQEAR